MRATVEHHEENKDLPPVKAKVTLGMEDLSIKVSLTLCMSPLVYSTVLSPAHPHVFQ